MRSSTADQLKDERSLPPRGAGSRPWLARGLLLAAAAGLVFSISRPYWGMRVKAPQYPKGLTLVVYADHLNGDVREIDMLNHYIGMRPLEQGAQTERKLAIPGILLAAAALLVAGWLSMRWALLFTLPAALIAPVFALDLFLWLRYFGLNLNPKAPLSSAIKPFVPTILGQGKIAQFDMVAWFGPGFWIAAAAGALGLAALWMLPRCRRPAGRHAVLAAAAISAAVWLGAAGDASARTLVVGPGGFATVQEAVDSAAEGDTVSVRAGRYAGPLIVRKRLTLEGEEGAVLDGGGRGTVVALEAPGIVMRGFTVRGSGDILSAEHTGIRAVSPGISIEGNRLEDVLFGISLRRAHDSVVRGNVVLGKPLPAARRGDAIRVWSSNDVAISGNRVIGGRDVVLWYSKRLAIRDNEFRRGRYGLHFMYCDGAHVEGNTVAENSVGIYLMYSANLLLRGNRMVGNRGPSGYGLGLKDMEGVRIEGNLLADNRVGVFLEHATGAWRGNRIAANDVGIWLWPSSQRNKFERNDLIDNGEQVTVQGQLGDSGNEWAGNFWSDYRGFDADGDGKGDVPYRAMHLFERLASRFPALRLYSATPAARTIEFAARLFPVFAPKSNLVDAQPRMRPLEAGR